MSLAAANMVRLHRSTKACRGTLTARSPSTVGGVRSESESTVFGLNTLPALPVAGRPSAPVTDSAGRQVRLSMSSTGSECIGRQPGTKGNLAWMSPASTCAAAADWARRRSGTSTNSSGKRTRPVAPSSTRASSWRRMRKLLGTMPEASPLCTPSPSTSTVSVPAAMPRSDVVAQSCS